MKVTINLTKEEYCGIRAIATQCGISTSDILVQFVADLTHLNRTGGSYERARADAYVRRCNYSGPLWGTDSCTPEVLQKKYDIQAKRATKWFETTEWFRRLSRSAPK